MTLPALPDRFEFSETGLVMAGNTTFDEWLACGETLKRIDRACQWWIGDWLNLGEQKWGEMYAQGIDETDLAYQTLANYKWVANAIQFSARAEKVGWKVHEQIAAIPEKDRASAIKRAETERWTVREVRDYVRELKASGQPHVAHNSGNDEWYTPPEFIDSAREVMGSIDIDPATCEKAQAWIKAEVYYTKKNSGLDQQWTGNVWMNPPYSQPLIQRFCDAVCLKWDCREFSQAIVLVNNATETAWFQPPLNRCAAICFPAGRVRFIGADGDFSGAPLQGQAFLYFGDNPDLFCATFGEYGAVFPC